MDPKPRIPAAQYVRMSTEDQQYSIANQQAAILAYAENNGYMVTASYADPGKSGVAIKDRKELRRLLSDVMSGKAQFKTILVYDISRWGRFQDVDEAAHYEFLCRSAGIPVCYVAEQFVNDGSASSSIMKVLKRTMAAEYSRELGVKVFTGQRRIASLGFRSVGSAGFGLKRMMVSPDGKRKVVLKEGERKAIHTHRTVLVPGSKKEVACVRLIFRLAATGKTPKEIAREVNERGMVTSRGCLWRRSSIYRILTNEKYAGCNTYGKTTQKLSSISRVVEQQLWTKRPDAFASIVSPDVFSHVQKLLKKRGMYPPRSNASLIQAVRNVLARKGKLTNQILKKEHSLGFACYRRFGSILKAYEMVGYQPSSRTKRLSEGQVRMRILRKELYLRLKQLFLDRVRFLSLHRQPFRNIVEIDGQLRVAIYLCHEAYRGNSQGVGWLLRIRRLERQLPTLVCTVNQTFSQLMDFYMLPPPPYPVKTKILRIGQPWLSAGRKVEDLKHFCDIANEVASQPRNCDGFTTIGDVLISADNCTITIGQEETSLGPITFAIFKMLLLNAGEVVPRDRLLGSTSDPIETSILDAHIYSLRSKLGASKDRIQTVRGAGYRYVEPEEAEPPLRQSSMSLSVFHRPPLKENSPPPIRTV